MSEAQLGGAFLKWETSAYLQDRGAKRNESTLAYFGTSAGLAGLTIALESAARFVTKKRNWRRSAHLGRESEKKAIPRRSERKEDFSSCNQSRLLPRWGGTRSSADGEAMICRNRGGTGSIRHAPLRAGQKKSVEDFQIEAQRHPTRNFIRMWGWRAATRRWVIKKCNQELGEALRNFKKVKSIICDFMRQHEEGKKASSLSIDAGDAALR